MSAVKTKGAVIIGVSTIYITIYNNIGNIGRFCTHCKSEQYRKVELEWTREYRSYTIFILGLSLSKYCNFQIVNVSSSMEATS